MGLLVDGIWHDQGYDTAATGGRFVRKDSAYRSWVTPDGAAGPDGEPGFRAEAGRYHLYVSLACPWAHRVLIMRTLKGLEDAISLSVTNWLMGAEGWTFADGPGVVPDPLVGAHTVYQIYLAADPHCTGRATVPILWDKVRGAIVSNESAEIVRMLNSAFDIAGARPGDYYPEALRPEIDRVNAVVYERINNGVYRAGFATSQGAYDEAAAALFETLDVLEERLSRQRFLVGPGLTEADIRLFTSLIRFDAVYAIHFKCNLRQLAHYPALSAYTRDIFQLPGIAATIDFDHIRNHYFRSHPHINPTGIVPIGPLRDFRAPHGRERLGEMDPARPWLGYGG